MKRTLPILFCALISPSVWAVNVSNNLNNTAQVVSACSITTISNLNFGLFNPLAETNKTANGRVGVSCTKGNYATRVGYGVNSRLYKYTYEYGSVFIGVFVKSGVNSVPYTRSVVALGTRHTDPSIGCFIGFRQRVKQPEVEIADGCNGTRTHHLRGVV